MNTTPIQIEKQQRDHTKFYHVREDGVWEFFLDNHRMETFMACEQLFKFKHVENWSQRGVFSWPGNIGLWWAKAMEHYYNAMREVKLDRTLASELALLAWDECKMDDLKPNFPSSYEKFGGRMGAYNLIVEYFDATFGFEINNWKIVAAEAGFGLNKEVCLYKFGEFEIYWTGRPDLLVIEQGRLIPVDHKTVEYIDARTDAKFKPHSQTAGYIVAAQTIARSLGLDVTVDRCIINAVARNAPSDKPRDGKIKSRFKKIPVAYSVDEIEEWKLQIYNKVWRLQAALDSNTWLKNEKNCHVYQGCVFRPVCAVPPGSRDVVLKANYTQIEPWSPYVPDED